MRYVYDKKRTNGTKGLSLKEYIITKVNKCADKQAHLKNYKAFVYIPNIFKAKGDLELRLRLADFRAATSRKKSDKCGKRARLTREQPQLHFILLMLSQKTCLGVVALCKHAMYFCTDWVISTVPSGASVYFGRPNLALSYGRFEDAYATGLCRKASPSAIAKAQTFCGGIFALARMQTQGLRREAMLITTEFSRDALSISISMSSSSGRTLSSSFSISSSSFSIYCLCLSLICLNLRLSILLSISLLHFHTQILST